MENIDKVKQRFELLKMAREILNEDYINRRAEDHNKWVAENEELWRTKRRNLPYPPFAKYPTDEEIVRAAANLYDFIYTSDMPPIIDTPASVVEPTPEEPVAPTEVIPIEHTSVAEKSETPGPPVLEELKQKIPQDDLLSNMLVDNEIAIENNQRSMHGIKSLLPGWVRRTKE